MEQLLSAHIRQVDAPRFAGMRPNMGMAPRRTSTSPAARPTSEARRTCNDTPRRDAPMRPQRSARVACRTCRPAPTSTAPTRDSAAGCRRRTPLRTRARRRPCAAGAIWRASPPTARTCRVRRGAHEDARGETLTSTRCPGQRGLRGHVLRGDGQLLLEVRVVEREAALVRDTKSQSPDQQAQGGRVGGAGGCTFDSRRAAAPVARAKAAIVCGSQCWKEGAARLARSGPAARGAVAWEARGARDE